MRNLTIVALGSGWALHIDGVENPQVFISGAKAEAAALAVSRRLAKAGVVSRIKTPLGYGMLAERRIRPEMRRGRQGRHLQLL